MGKNIARKKTQTRTKQVKVELTPGTIYEIKPHAKYLLIITRSDFDQGSLSAINSALKTLFDGKILALFADQLTTVKIAELLENK